MERERELTGPSVSVGGLKSIRQGKPVIMAAVAFVPFNRYKLSAPRRSSPGGGVKVPMPLCIFTQTTCL
jgi:hypothetical protein